MGAMRTGLVALVSLLAAQALNEQHDSRCVCRAIALLAFVSHASFLLPKGATKMPKWSPGTDFGTKTSDGASVHHSVASQSDQGSISILFVGTIIIERTIGLLRTCFRKCSIPSPHDPKARFWKT